MTIKRYTVSKLQHKSRRRSEIVCRRPTTCATIRPSPISVERTSSFRIFYWFSARRTSFHLRHPTPVLRRRAESNINCGTLFYTCANATPILYM